MHTCIQTIHESFVIIRSLTKIQNILNKEFANVCGWHDDNKLSIQFGEDKTKCILSIRDKNLPEFNITDDNNRIKKYCILKIVYCILYT